MHSDEATVTRVRRCTGSPSNSLLSILPSCRFRVHIEVTRTNRTYESGRELVTFRTLK